MMTEKGKTDKRVTIWAGCYEGGWNSLIVPEAFSHPAKFSYALTRRMFEHARDKGWISKGSVVVDPFGGVGTGGIIAAYADIQWIGCELEQKFVDLARENFELHRRKWEGLGCPQPVIIQGDSREMCTVLGAADAIISSPPYAESMEKPGGIDPAKSNHTYGPHSQMNRSDTRYGHTHGQLGSMKPGQLADCLISSPPYATGSIAKNSKGIDRRKQWETYRASGGGQSYEGFVAVQEKHAQEYGATPGQLQNLKPGKVDCVVSSPPYEGEKTHPSLGHPELVNGGKGDYLRLATTKTHIGSERYGDSPGNIGNDKGPTFWQAAKEIVQQCHQILKPGGHAIWVVKAFVRKGKRVDFPGDWRRLCESVGFKTVCTHHAMLVKETTDDGLFGEITEKKSKKSFFRRLAEAKGSPAIDYEVILCMEK